MSFIPGNREECSPIPIKFQGAFLTSNLQEYIISKRESLLTGQIVSQGHRRVPRRHEGHVGKGKDGYSQFDLSTIMMNR